MSALRQQPHSPRWLALLLLSLPVLAGFVEALRRAWICDDIFITLRNIQNLFAGHGMVFNAGERVESYTHFLWAMLLAALHRVGVDLVWSAQYVSILLFGVLLATLWWRAMRRAAPAIGIPIAACCLAIHYDMQIYASGGLETMAYTLALLWAVLVASRAPVNWALAGACYAIATLLRPEGAMHAVVAAGALAVWHRNVRGVLRFAGTWLLLVLPSEIFRLAYYGDPLPNTFYAKSGSDANWLQGWHYVWLYFRVYAVQALCLLAMLGIVVHTWRRGRQVTSPTLPSLATAQLAMLHTLVGLLYVVRLGGDFMFARFLIPVTPLLFLILEDAVTGWRSRMLQVAVAVVAFAGTWAARLPHGELLPGRERVHGIVNEYNYYPEHYLDTLRRQGEVLGRALQGTDAGVGLLSGQDAIAYYGRLQYALEPHGLADRIIARRPITERGRPGHERAATLEDMLLRQVQFRMRYGFTVGLSMERQIRFEELYGEIVYYDADLMAQLRGRPGINFLDYPEYLRGQLPNLTGNAGRLVEDYRQAHLFYFIHNDDAGLLAEYRAALLARSVPAQALDGIDAQAAAFQEVLRTGSLRPRPAEPHGR